MFTKPLAATAAIVIAATAQAQLVNGDFETAGGATVFDSWDQFGLGMGNISQSTELAASGSTFSAKLFGQFVPGEQNDTGIFQIIPANAGSQYTAKVSVAVGSADPLGTAEIGVAILIFQDAMGATLSEVVQDVANSSTPANDAFTEFELTGVAPAGTTQVQLLLLHVQLSEADGVRGGATYWDDASITEEVPGAALINPSFDQTVESTAFADWDESGNVINNIEQVNIFPADGAFNFKVFGQFIGADNRSEISQTFDAAPGDSFMGSVQHAQVVGDGLAGGNFGYLEVFFLDAGGNVIGGLDTTTALPGDTPSTYQTASVSTTPAPLGTTSVQITIGLFQQGFNGGAIQYDLASLVKNGNEELVTNGSFEVDGGGSGILGWETEGPNVFVENALACDGSNNVKIFGQFISEVNRTRIFQALQANPGSEWTAGITALQDISDFLQGDNLGILRIAFFDGSGNELAASELIVGDQLNPFNFCQEFTLDSDPAPAGTTTVRIEAILEQDAADSGGSIFFDDAALFCVGGDCSVNTGPTACSPADITTDGDNNGIPDGLVTLSDFSFYLTLWSSGDAAADLTTDGDGDGIPDGLVTLSDFSFYLTLWSAGCP